MKPVLFWGVVRENYRSGYRAIRVSRDAGHQISGVRVGDIGAVTLRSTELVGRYKSQENAEEAIKQVGQVRAPYEAEMKRLRELERAQDAQMKAHEKKVFATMPGSLTADVHDGGSDPDHAGGF